MRGDHHARRADTRPWSRAQPHRRPGGRPTGPGPSSRTAAHRPGPSRRPGTTTPPPTSNARAGNGLSSGARGPRPRPTVSRRAPIRRALSRASAAAITSFNSASDATVRHRRQVPAPEPADLAFHPTLLVRALHAGLAEERVETVMRTQRDEPRVLQPLPTQQHPHHRRLQVVVADHPGRHPTQALRTPSRARPGRTPAPGCRTRRAPPCPNATTASRTCTTCHLPADHRDELTEVDLRLLGRADGSAAPSPASGQSRPRPAAGPPTPARSTPPLPRPPRPAAAATPAGRCDAAYAARPDPRPASPGPCPHTTPTPAPTRTGVFRAGGTASANA